MGNGKIRFYLYAINSKVNWLCSESGLKNLMRRYGINNLSKKVKGYYSVRIGMKYRALGMGVEEGILWFWIGTHLEYDEIIFQIT